MLFFRSQFAEFKGKPRPAHTYRAARRNAHRSAGWEGIQALLREQLKPIHFGKRTYAAMKSALLQCKLVEDVADVFETLLSSERIRRDLIQTRNDKWKAMREAGEFPAPAKTRRFGRGRLGRKIPVQQA